MVYRSKKRPYRPRRGAKSIYKKKKATVNVNALARKVNYMSKRQKNLTERVQYTVNWDQPISANYFVVSLVRPPSWQSVFGESDNVLESQKINITKVNIDWLLSPGKESAQIDYTVFLISAKNNKVFRETQSLTTFQNNPSGQQDYTDAPITFMNPKRFKIWKTWRVQTSGITTRVNGTLTPDVNVVNANHYARRYMKMPFKRYLRTTTAQLGWKTINAIDIPISASLALVAFNNNSAADIENPNFQGTALFSCYV